MAPHGGLIEPGTSLIARAIAGTDRSLYLFEGLRRGRKHGELHITSERFDEPGALRMTAEASGIVAVHGRADLQDGRLDGQTVWVGGRDAKGRKRVVAALQRAGFPAVVAMHALTGQAVDNICDRGLTGAGVQLELSRSLRQELEADALRHDAFARAVRDGSA